MLQPRGRDGSQCHTLGHRRCGFTLVELLAVIAILVLLLSLLLPTILAARRRANTVVCASNLRQICLAMLTYASDYDGAFPPNSIGRGLMWCDNDRIMKYLTKPGAAVPPVMACPSDEDAIRSYSMNIWASSIIDDYVLTSPTRCGEPWGQSAGNPAQLILVAEKWSYFARLTGWEALTTIGVQGVTPGRRFGGGVGLVPMMETSRFGVLNCELPYERHRLGGDGGVGTEPKGRVNFGYADGHVATRSHAELVDQRTGRSTFDSLWCPADYALEP